MSLASINNNYFRNSNYSIKQKRFGNGLKPLPNLQNISFKGKNNKNFSLYPPIKPYKTQLLPVSDIHKLHIAEYGNPKGIPVIFLHGGPGFGTSDEDARFFDPKAYHIILVDQRGAGKSEPYATLKENTTPKLVEDLEKVRKHLKIDKWLVFGQSWGTTLGIAYSEKYPDKISGLILQGVFMGRPEEIKWLYQEGANRLFPKQWENYIAPIPLKKRNNILQAYKELLTSPDETVRKKAAGNWNSWEGSLLKKIPDPKFMEEFGDPALALLECTFALNKYFLKQNQLLNNADKIKNIPTWIIQGKCDWVCPPKTAWELHKALPKSKLMEIPESGHSNSEPLISKAWLQASEEFKNSQNKSKINCLV